MKKILCSLLIASIHAILCSLVLNKVFGFNTVVLWGILITIGLIIIVAGYCLILMPFIKQLYHIIASAAKHEVNQIIDERSLPISLSQPNRQQS